jgi:hypothetical protein
VAVAGGLGALTVAVSLVDTTIANDVQAYISGEAGDMSAPAATSRSRRIVDDARIEDVITVTASVAVGAIAAAGGGLKMDSTVDNTVEAGISGPITVMTPGDITVEAKEIAFIEGDAINVTVAFGLGLAIGVSLVKNEIKSDIDAQVDGSHDRGRQPVGAGNSIAEIPTTNTAGIAASFGVSVAGNRAAADIRTRVSAEVSTPRST